MSEVLIIARTRMRDRRICVGAVEMATGRLLRLLATNGMSFLETAAFQPGEVWDALFRDHPQPVPPHVEDVRVVGMRKLPRTVDVHRWLLEQAGTVPLWRRFPDDLYDGALLFPRRNPKEAPHAAYVERDGRMPSRSLGLWLTDRLLVRRETRQEGRARCRYDCMGRDADDVSMGLPFAGFGRAPLVIPPGSIVSLSLARWWSPEGSRNIPARCYVQLCDVLSPAAPVEMVAEAGLLDDVPS